jgi:hypothetical protein
MIYMQWPSSSAWAIGTPVGVSMIISGVTRVMLSLAVRKVADTISSKWLLTRGTHLTANSVSEGERIARFRIATPAETRHWRKQRTTKWEAWFR